MTGQCRALTCSTAYQCQAATRTRRSKLPFRYHKINTFFIKFFCLSDVCKSLTQILTIPPFQGEKQEANLSPRRKPLYQQQQFYCKIQAWQCCGRGPFASHVADIKGFAQIEGIDELWLVVLLMTIQITSPHRLYFCMLVMALYSQYALPPVCGM